jgi:ATP-dependent DNA helicase PIF1
MDKLSLIEVTAAVADVPNSASIADKFSDEQKYGMDMLRSGNSVLLMGVAGSGKSTLLREYLWEMQEKEPKEWEHTAVVAPTGVAAVNVGGSTLHSFFQLPPYVLDPEDASINKSGKWSKIRTLIIDEISMVRSDMFACLDRRLRAGKGQYEGLPFGGVRIILIGDVCQLEPVMPNAGNAEYDFLMDNFGSGWFFNTEEFNKLRPVPVYLTRTFRQEDTQLSSLLDRVRRGDKSAADDINRVLVLNPQADGSGGPVVCPTLKQVDDINMEMLNKIDEETKVYKGVRIGSFKEGDQRTDSILELKVGARVLAVANYYSKSISPYDWAAKSIKTLFINGDPGVVTDLDPLTVDFDRHGEIKVDRYTWESIKYDYVYNDKRKRMCLERKVVGSFTQIPLKLGWAITIHKSQGMGFENMVVDMGRGAFSSGQTYVALSRAMSLAGLVLRTPIMPRDIFTDPNAIMFHDAAVRIAQEEYDKVKARYADKKEEPMAEPKVQENAVINIEDAAAQLNELGKVIASLRFAAPEIQREHQHEAAACLNNIATSLGLVPDHG